MNGPGLVAPPAWLAIAAAAIIASPAVASGVLPIGGVFGNEAGCRQYLTGQRADEVALLTEHTFTHGRTGCYLESLEASADGQHAVAALCGTPGEAAANVRIDVRPAEGTGGYMAAFADGRVFGPLLPCPGVEHLFAPEGTRA